MPILVEVNRVLKTGGWLYLTTPNAGNIVKRLRIIRGLTTMDPVENFFGALMASDGGIVGMHWREYMRYELQELLQRTGFSLLRHYYCHYAGRHHRSLLRRKLVKLMYYFFSGLFSGTGGDVEERKTCRCKHPIYRRNEAVENN